MVKDRNEIVHVLPGPWYGPGENAFNTINRDLPEFSHVFVDCSAMVPGFSPSHDWVSDVSAIQYRASQHVLPEDREGLARLVSRALFVIVYGDCPIDLSDLPEGRFSRWGFRGDNDVDFTAVPHLSPGVPVLYPMLDYDRLIGLAGRVTKPTAGVFWDPNSEKPLGRVAELLVGKLGKDSRIVSTESSEPESPSTDSGETPGSEHVVRRWEIGFDWMYCPLCDAVACNAGDESYPFMLVCAMAMGKACVAVRSTPDSPLPEYVRHAVTCLVADDPETASDMVRWLMANPEKSRKLGAAAQASVCNHDKDSNLVKLRRAVFG